MPPSRIQTLRSSTRNLRPASGTREPGELYVNFADRQIGYVDGGKVPVDVVAVRFFVTSTQYAVGDLVAQSGTVYRCVTVTGPGAFNPLHWLPVGEVLEAPDDTKIYGRQSKAWAETITKATYDADLGSIDGDLAGADARLDAIEAEQVTQNNNIALKAPTNSPTFTGDPKAPTPPTADNDTRVATTAFVKTNLASYVPLADPAFTGNPTAPTPAASDNDTSIATTAFVVAKLTAGGYISEAPLDGQQYARQSAGWAAIDVPPGTIISESPPPDPATGQLWWQPSTATSYIWDGDSWDITNTGGVSIADTPPPDAQHGDLWWESDSGALLAYYNDGSSQQWVEVSEMGPPGAPGPLVACLEAPPSLPQVGQMWWDAASGRLFIWYDDGNTKQWVQISGPLAISGFVKKTVIVATTSSFQFQPSTVWAEIEVQGGGGGGGGTGTGSATSTASAGSGGGGGGYAKKTIQVTPAVRAATKTIAIGAAGVGAVGNTVATGGGQTGYNDTVNALNGNGGSGATTGVFATQVGIRVGAQPGGAGGGDLNIPGQPGTHGFAFGNSPNGAAGIAATGAGNGGGSVLGYGGSGSVFFAASANNGSAGNPGYQGGGGGGGSAINAASSAQSGGNGGAGLCVITEYS